MTIALNHLGKLGQLGNQMFQYAAIKGITSKLNVPFMIPDHREIFDDGIGNRYTILLYDAFNLDGQRGILQTQNYIQEGDFYFQERFFNVPPSKPVKEIILMLLSLQYLAALIIFLEFPLVDNAINMSSL